MEAQAFDTPFRHWQIKNLVPSWMISNLYTHIPPANDRAWIRYDNDCEKGKWVIPAVYAGALGEEWTNLFLHLVSPGFVKTMRELTEIPDLEADEYWHGSGLHLSLPGSRLQPHVDYAIHPNGMERRVSLVIYIQSGWEPDWGGATELCDIRGEVVKRIFPVFNSSTIWLNSDESVHAVQPMPKNAPCRITAACYYLTKARPGATRRRAMFLPNRG